MSTATIETNAYLIPKSKPEMVTKKRAMFTDDVISDVTITGSKI